MKISIFISILTWIPWKKLNTPPRSAILRDFLKSGTPLYNSEVPDTAGRKTRRRRTQAIAKRFAFYANAKKFPPLVIKSLLSPQLMLLL